MHEERTFLHRPSIIGIGLSVLLTASAAAQQPTCKIQFNVSDSAGRPMHCRIHVANERGQPQKALGQPFWNDHFVCSGRVSVDVVAGRYRWQIERGPEYERQSGTVDVGDEKVATVDVTLKRITNLRDQGWYSGDLHVHRPIEEIETLMRAEDLDFAPVITWWNSRDQWNGKPIPKQTAVQFDGHRAYTVMAGEDEREGGALLYFGLDRPLALPDRRRSPEFPSPMRFVQQAHQRNAKAWIDIEKPFWWDVPVWLASGKMNSIGIANNHMCRSKMLANEAWGRPRDTTRLPNPRGNGFWTQEVYYHALNAGLRIPPSAGSASGVLPNPVGYNRMYTYVGTSGQPEMNDWFDAVSNGRCFVTNGPLLRVTVDGKHSGEILRKPNDAPLAVKLSVELTSMDRIAELAVIHNGRMIKRVDCSADLHQQKTIDMSLSESGWFLVRAIADVEQTFRFASTAPWYVESKSTKHRISKTSARFFLDWVDQRIMRIRNNVTDQNELQSVLQPHIAARDFWQKRIENANADLNGEDDVPATSAQVSQQSAE